jgi:hypothetical protein
MKFSFADIQAGGIEIERKIERKKNCFTAIIMTV